MRQRAMPEFLDRSAERNNVSAHMEMSNSADRQRCLSMQQGNLRNSSLEVKQRDCGPQRKGVDLASLTWA